MSRKPRISYWKAKKIVRAFCNDLTALQTADIVWVNRNTVNRYYMIFREYICGYQAQLFAELRMKWLIEIDESYFGARRIRWFRGKLKRWRWTRKQPVFWLLKRDGRVYTQIIPNCTAQTLQSIIADKVDNESTVLSDGWKGYDGLVDIGYDKHYRVIHNENERSKGKGVHINGIENFWSFTKRRLNKFNGVKVNFPLHLKECERRYWKTKDQMYTELVELLKNTLF